MKLGFALPIVGSAVSSAAGLSAFCRGQCHDHQRHSRSARVHQTFPTSTDVPARQAKWTITDLPGWWCGFDYRRPLSRTAGRKIARALAGRDRG
jgi:hypothetical protein